MATSLSNNSILTQLIDEYLLVFELLGFQIIQINPDLDFFTLHITTSNKYKNTNEENKLESLLIGSIELFNRLLFQSEVHHQSNNYFLNLHPLPIGSKKLQIQIDYLTTIDSIVCLEAYCYDEGDLLIAKAGTVYTKKSGEK
jgi:hypothetical protein